MSNILGLDASTKSTGYAVFKDNTLINYDKIVFKDKDAEWYDRLRYMCKEIIKLIKQHNIDTLIVEKPVRTLANVNTLEQLFMLHGAIMIIAFIFNIKFISVDVNQWRSKIGLLEGIKRNDKDKRTKLKERSVCMANELYGLNLVWKSKTSKFNDDDISDAILITHSIIT